MANESKKSKWEISFQLKILMLGLQFYLNSPKLLQLQRICKSLELLFRGKMQIWEKKKARGPENQTVLQEYILGNGFKNVSVSVRGKGSALTQETWSYFTFLFPEGSAFARSVYVSSIMQ